LESLELEIGMKTAKLGQRGRIRINRRFKSHKQWFN